MSVSERENDQCFTNCVLEMLVACYVKINHCIILAPKIQNTISVSGVHIHRAVRRLSSKL